MKKLAVRPENYVQQLCCDRCGRTAEAYDSSNEFQEFTSVDYKGGYRSVFGDGNKVAIDLCQHCMFELLGPWIRITDPLAGFDIARFGGEFPMNTVN
jgi:hypothetical protein